MDDPSSSFMLVTYVSLSTFSCVSNFSPSLCLYPHITPSILTTPTGGGVGGRSTPTNHIVA
nr:hypothetical protein Itr_chr04CG16530 [Ipomoea trifida]GMC47925.1 hypothetical protein Iba_scaffold29631CG0020 [Ipomoea batatas]GMC86641.1 hypothetical protein Iba_chr04dCG12740 [Ipomoea batatas]